MSNLSEEKKKNLLKHVQFIMTDLPVGKHGSVKGNQSLAQEVINRIEQITKNPDEFKYLVDAVSLLILKSKGAEAKIMYNGVELTREVLAKDFGVFLAPKQRDGAVKKRLDKLK